MARLESYRHLNAQLNKGVKTGLILFGLNKIVNKDI